MGKKLPPQDYQDDYLIEPKEFKNKICLLLKDYADVKKDMLELGYHKEDDQVIHFKLKDYIEWYINLHKSR